MLTIETVRAEAASLLSVNGENPEYDRALAELVTFVSGGISDDVPDTLDALRSHPQSVYEGSRETLTIENGVERDVDHATDYWCQECSTLELYIYHEREL